MPNVDRRWIAPAIIAAAFAASAIAYTRLPPIVTLRMSGLLPFAVPDNAEPGPRWMAAFLIPSVSILLWLGFRFATTERAQRVGRWFFRNAPAEATSAGQFERFAKTYETIVLAVVTLILGIHAGLLAAAFQRSTMAARIIGLSLALFMIAAGNVMPRLRPNWVAGVRLTRTLADPDLWRTTHRAFGAALVVAGVLTLVVALAAPRYALVTGVALLVLSLAVAFVITMGGNATKPPAIVAGLAVFLGAASSDGQATGPRQTAPVVAPISVVQEAVKCDANNRPATDRECRNTKSTSANDA